MADIVTVLQFDGRESIPIVGTLHIDANLGDFVEAAQDRFYIRPGYILRQHVPNVAVEPPRAQIEASVLEPEPAPAPEEPAAPTWEIDPENPYAHLSPTMQKMLKKRDEEQAAAAAPIAPVEEPKPKKKPRKRKLDALV